MILKLRLSKHISQLNTATCTALAISLCILTFGGSEKMQNRDTISLPTPEKSGRKTVEKTLANRRSIREYSAQPLTLQQISQFCWPAAGETVDAVSGATRTYPSAGGIYPCELYVAAGKVNNLPPGIYNYDRRNNNLVLKGKGDFRNKISKSALGQSSMKETPINFIMTADIEETTKTYVEGGHKLYIHMEAGCAAQNIHLQCESLQLETVIIGVFPGVTAIRHPKRCR